MYLAVMIDSENYTNMEHYSCQSIEEGFELFEEYFVKSEAEYEIKGNRIVATYEDSYGDRDFAVCEVYKVDEKPYKLIWWHAYDGVDFTVRTFDSFEEAREVMIAEVDELVFKVGDVYLDSEDRDSACVDTGREWENWRIV